MIFQEQLGFIYYHIRAMLHFYYKLSLFLLKNNLMPRSRLLEVIMIWNFIVALFKSSTLPEVLLSSLLMLIPLNKMGWLRENINTFYKLPGLSCFSLIFPKNFGEKHCLQLLIFLTEHLSLLLATRHLLKFCMVPNPLTHILKLLDVFVIHQPKKTHRQTTI